ncbi:nesprin-4 isoform X2 [Elephas maximus indicus]|uniref:nesprin-4 isoform X2 n=1 Tax=Elephas maximus indicus TaxID=99487 RepID=UPI0021171656|nr:nesprin-4 isoform X2 [Elephas maximus indicus]
MALPLPPDPGTPSEPLDHPPGAPREPDTAGCTLCSASEEEGIRLQQAQKLGQDSLDPLENFQGGLGGTEPTTSTPRLPTASSHEEPAGGRHCEHLISGHEVLEAEQDSLGLCFLGLGLQQQHLDLASAQSGMVQLQADLRGAAESVDALLAFSEGLARQGELPAQASQEQVLRALRAQRDSIFRWLWRLQAKLVFEEADRLDQDLEAEGDSDGQGPGGVWGPWAPGGLPTPAELEWDPAGDVGGLGPLGQKAVWTPGVPCELCGHRGSQGRGQDLENISSMEAKTLSISTCSVSPALEQCLDMLTFDLSHRKHLSSHRRRSLTRKPQDKKRQASPSPQDVMLGMDPGAAAPAPRQPLTFLLLLLLFFLLVGAMLPLPISGGLCCSHAQLARTPYLVLSYVNGPPPT